MYVWSIISSIVVVTVISVVYSIVAVVKYFKKNRKTNPKMRTKMTKVQEFEKEDFNFDQPSESKLALQQSKINEESKDQMKDAEILRKNSFVTNTPSLTPQPSKHFRKIIE